WIAERALRNVELVVGGCRDMAQQYRRGHATVAPFTARSTTKPAPHSLIESLACGRPVVTTDLVGLAGGIGGGSAGRGRPPTGGGIAEELDRLQREWDRYAGRARRLAEQRFGMAQFVDGYGRLYEEVVGDAARYAGRRGRPGTGRLAEFRRLWEREVAWERE